MKRIIILYVSLVFCVMLQAVDFDGVEIKAHKVTDSIYYLEGEGGNIGVCIGPDGVLLVDDQYPELSTKIVNAVAGLTNQVVEIVINTHYHFDHSGGNEDLASAGALLLSHENTRELILQDIRSNYPDVSERLAVPKMTFKKAIGLHLNGEAIEVLYFGRGHTDGDVVVYFKDSNVIHMGDLYVEYGYPYVDMHHGGNINGMIDVLEIVLGFIDDETQVIPGHGELANRSDVVEFRRRLKVIRDEVSLLRDEGFSLSQIKEKLKGKFNEFGWGSPVDWLGMVWESLEQE